jgi:hypothetical protein
MMTLLPRLVAFVLFVALALCQFGHAQQGQKIVPKLEAIAETKLIMEGLAHANFKGLERRLSQAPDAQAWVFARGQALLLAETGNLLMLRPPRTAAGETTWFERTVAFRSQATQLAQVIAKKDLERARAGLGQLAQTCNRCHQSFRVPVEIEPFADTSAE